MRKAAKRKKGGWNEQKSLQAQKERERESLGNKVK